MNIVRTILVVVAVISIGVNIWLFRDRSQSQATATAALTEFANGVSQGLNAALAALNQDNVNWALVYAGVSAADTSAHAAGLLFYQLPGDQRDIAQKIAGFHGDLYYYGASILDKVQGQEFGRDEVKTAVFARTLTSFPPLSERVSDTSNYTQQFILWLDTFEHALHTDSAISKISGGRMPDITQMAALPLFKKVAGKENC